MTRKVDFFTPRARRIMLRTPQLFDPGPWDPSTTSIGFGFQCGAGWLPLIQKTLSDLARIAREDGLDRMKVRQVKEKFGQLRIYLSNGNERAQATVIAAQLRSLTICDLCGGAVLTPPPRMGWIFTRCTSCQHGKTHAEEVLKKTRLLCGPSERQFRALILGDLHLDFWLQSKEEPLPGLDRQVFDMIDLVVLAGDITNKSHVRWRTALEWLAERVSLDKVWAFPGNHDAYSGQLDRDDKLREIIEEYGGHFGQKSEIRLGGRRFLCCTLWTDMQLGGALADNMAEAAKLMNDYKYIRLAKRGYARLRPMDTVAIHQDQLDWLDIALAAPFEGETVVVTHHAPLLDCLAPGHSLPAAYASDLRWLIERHQPALWMHGHVHQQKDFDDGRTRVRNVALGYPPSVEPEQPLNDPLCGLVTWVGPK